MYCWAVATLLHPTRGIFSEYLQQYEEGWLSRLRYVWYPLVIALPLSLAGLAVFGYVYTARQLAVRFFVSVFLASGAFVIFSLLSRSILIQRRKLRIAQARQRQQAATSESSDATGTPAPVVEDFLVSDLQDQTLQTRRFVAIVLLGVVLVGLWAAWSDVLPALGFLERWPLWTSTRMISEPKTDETGATLIVSTRNRQTGHHRGPGFRLPDRSRHFGGGQKLAWHVGDRRAAAASTGKFSTLCHRDPG